MSRSRKKISIHTDRRDKKDKRLANKKVRQLSIDFYLPDGNCWKKLFESWDICDWKFKTFAFEHDIYINFYNKTEKEWEEMLDKGFRK